MRYIYIHFAIHFSCDFDWEYPSCVAEGEEDRVCAPSADKVIYLSSIIGHQITLHHKMYRPILQVLCEN